MDICEPPSKITKYLRLVSSDDGQLVRGVIVDGKKVEVNGPGWKAPMANQMFDRVRELEEESKALRRAFMEAQDEINKLVEKLEARKRRRKAAPKFPPMPPLKRCNAMSWEDEELSKALDAMFESDE